MNDDIEAFQAKFRLPELQFHDDGHWLASVRPEQITLGAMVISTRREILNLGDLSADEARSLGGMFGMAEELARDVYGAVRINILCLMMKDPIVHFHVLPRYAEEVRRHDLVWVDQDWPGPPVVRAAETTDEHLFAIREALTEAVAGRSG